MRWLFLDRDGVINEESRAFIKSPADWKPLSGSLEAIARAQRAGFRIIVVSNQSGIARGLLDIAALNAIHRRLIDDLAHFGGHIDAFFFCPHGPQDDCSCRKPKPGLLLTAKERLGLDLAETPFIGDRICDLAAAKRAGAKPILVRTGIDVIGEAELRDVGTVDIFDTLTDAVNAVIAAS